MKSLNEDVRMSIEESAPIYLSARRADIALQVRSKMLEKGLKNRDIAERLGVSEANVSRWLRGNQNLSIDTIYQLADALEEPVRVSIGNIEPVMDAEAGESIPPGLGDWAVRQELEMAAASGSCGIFSLDAYRQLRQDHDSQRPFTIAGCETGIDFDDEERMRK